MTEILPTWWIWTLVILWGALWGSFANVVIARVPLGQSIVFPASHCPECETPIRWYDNLPILSWFMLRGRCRSCAAKIPAQYPLVELGGIVCALAAAWAVGGGPSFWRLHDSPPWEVASAWMLLSFFFLLLMMLTIIDLKHLLLPHVLTITLAVLAFIYAFVVPPGGDWRGFVPSISVRDSAIGFVVAYGGLLLFAMSYAIIRGRQGMGGGDFMLFGALGAWFGIEALPMLMLLAAFQGVLLYTIGLFFFPSLIHEVAHDDEEFWTARTGDASRDKMPDASDISEKSFKVGAPTTPLPSKAAGGRGEQSPQPKESSRGVPFGPFLCLAAVEFVAFGGMYFQWLHGGV